MAAQLPPDHVLTLPTSHSPFFSAPEALARHIDAISRRATVNSA
jgi:hypothetical protein